MQNFYYLNKSQGEAVQELKFTCCEKTLDARGCTPFHRTEVLSFCPFCGEKLYGVSDPNGYFCHYDESDGFIYTGEMPTKKNYFNWIEGQEV